MKTVSVIVPALNEEKYIGECLKSIRAQKTIFPYEVIVVDGKSEDRTVEIAKKYADKVFVTGRGIWKGRNLGAENAEGKILTFIDADTIIPQDYMNKTVASLILLEAAALSTGFSYDKNTEEIKIIQEIQNDLSSFMVGIGMGEIQGYSIVIWKDVFMKNGGFENTPAEDIAFSEKLRNNKQKIIFVREPHVITSCRRIEKMGLNGTLNYYLSLRSITDKILERFTKKYSKYRKYFPVR